MPIVLRPPTASTVRAPADLSPPSPEYLSGTWHVTHSTLPMWRKSRNVQIKYTPLEPVNGVAQIGDNVSHQLLRDTAIKNINGVDIAENDGWGYKWRGKGWLRIASSEWEVLGYGKEDGTDNDYCVTFFNKTMFTPPGVDFYSRSSEGLKPETVEALRKALDDMGDDTLKKLASSIFKIKMDDARK